ncbi:MAG TPA: prepilin-type N-terminal cleavage/methylation domain-containing protein [Symbiobacteriaceae bacterium]|nr:prepilin-type N-terminal cleavage/methylation domain-containing protein [Symbiobacteriaceae bacterium]
MKRIAQLRRSQEGFTLIELLVVVAIIALLATFAVPKLFDAINKAKATPGQADMQTISGALERYYMDSNLNTYPTSTVEAALSNGYLKSTTTWKNGYKQAYIYGSTSTGSAYVLIDLAGTTVTGMTATTLSLTCNATSYTFTVAANTNVYANYAIAAGDIASCAGPTGSSVVRN